jgi:hypothetical protein
LNCVTNSTVRTSERIWQMPDLITNERLGELVTKLWIDYLRGIILLSEFKDDVLSLTVSSRGLDIRQRDRNGNV